MFSTGMPPAVADPDQYRTLATELAAILAGERDWLANLANTAAILFQSLPNLNWAGFYLFTDGQLVLGPFQGRPACVRIGLDRGVCGAAATARQTLVVPDVHQFPGHIACDSASNSEIVVPLLLDDLLLGVMDLDSPKVGRFTDEDASGLEAIGRLLVEACDWNRHGGGDSKAE
jgi:L-methionine (R)-S-oxide reductase